MNEDLEVLKRALIVADLDLGVAAAHRLVDSGSDPRWILEEGMAVAMFDLGEMWKRGEVFLPEVVASAEVFKRCNEIVEPALLAQRDDAEANAVVVLATVKGDLHDLGKNMVGAMLRTSGFDVHDMGKDVSADRIVEVFCIETNAQGGVLWIARPDAPQRLRLVGVGGLVRIDDEANS